MINLDEIRKEIAIKQDTLLGENDPVLMLATMVDVLLKQSVATLNEQQRANLEALLKAAQRGIVEMRVEANKVIAEGTAYASDQLHNGVSTAFDEGREEIRKDLRLAWNKIDQARKVAVFSAAVSVCALIAVLAMFNVA